MEGEARRGVLERKADEWCARPRRSPISSQGHFPPTGSQPLSPSEQLTVPSREARAVEGQVHGLWPCGSYRYPRCRIPLEYSPRITFLSHLQMAAPRKSEDVRYRCRRSRPVYCPNGRRIDLYLLSNEVCCSESIGDDEETRGCLALFTRQRRQVYADVCHHHIPTQRFDGTSNLLAPLIH